jgi:hypothetical protein
MAVPGRWLTFGAKPTRGAGVAAARIVVLSFLIGYSLDVLAAVLALAQARSAAENSSAGTDRSALAGYALTLGFAVLAALLGMRTARSQPLGLSMTQLGLSRPAGVPAKRAWSCAAIYAAVIAAAIWGTVDLLGLVGVHGTGASSTSGNLTAELFHTCTAGVDEEPVLLALPLALAARVRWSWWAVFSLLVALRLSFHIYYGWQAVFVVPWIAGAMLLWRWCPVLWPFIVGHSLFDVLQFMRASTNEGVAALATAAATGLCLAGGAAAAVAIARWWPGTGRGGAVVPENLVG